MIGAATAMQGDDVAALIARITSSAVAGVARRALVLRLSRLPVAFARPHHLRLARAALDPLRSEDHAELFDLPSSDTVVLWRGSSNRALRACLDAVSELFAGTGYPGADPSTLCLVLDLPEQADTLLRLAWENRAEIPDRRPIADMRTPLDAGGLAGLESVLARADVARFVRRRPVCAATQGGGLRLAWEKRVLSVGELESALAPDSALRAEPWLFRRLTRTLDRRMLALLASPGELQDVGPFALDLNVASILSADFLRFDATLPAALRGRVVLDLRAPDILSDLPAFLLARDFAHARGYRILLHGIGAELLGALPLMRLGLDLLQLRWSAALAEAEPETLGADPARLMLGQADTAQAVAWGRLRGIGLFQGRAAIPRP